MKYLPEGKLIPQPEGLIPQTEGLSLNLRDYYIEDEVGWGRYSYHQVSLVKFHQPACPTARTPDVGNFLAAKKWS